MHSYALVGTEEEMKMMQDKFEIGDWTPFTTGKLEGNAQGKPCTCFGTCTCIICVCACVRVCVFCCNVQCYTCKCTFTKVFVSLLNF